MQLRLDVLVVLLALPLLASPLAVQAQQTGKPYRAGFLGNSTAALEANLVGPFREGLRDLGYVDGRNVLIDYRWAEGKYERLPALIGELIYWSARGRTTGGGKHPGGTV
jgi:putative ABC transport system substrate-binding protein